MKILLLGKNGQVGHDLQYTLLGLGNIIALDYPDIDFSDAEQLRSLVRQHSPKVIINAAAYTNVEKAEDEPGVAMAINGTAPGVLAEESKKLGALLIHYSTDYVYDGTGSRPYTETDKPNPLNSYGRSKLAGDEAVLGQGGWSRVLRTSWVYSTRGANFIRTIVSAAAEGKPLRIIDDQYGTPTWSGWLALVTRHIIARELYHSSHPTSDLRPLPVLYNCTASGHTSWFDFTKAFLTLLKFDPGYIDSVVPIPGSEYKVKARRPGFSVLSNEKLAKDHGLEIPTWEEMLAVALRGATVESLSYQNLKT